VSRAGLIWSAASGAAATAAAHWSFNARRGDGSPGSARWTRTNHRGEKVTLLEGPTVVAGLAAGAAVAPGVSGPLRRAAVAAALGAGCFGVYDDLAGRGDRRGIRGHLGALARGEVTSGAVKIAGIGATGLAAAWLSGRRGAGLVVSGGVVASTANLVNLLDLRPGRALKAGLVLTILDGRRGADAARLAAVAAGSALVVLPADLQERSMLGDAGANALGAVLGTVALARADAPSRLLLRLGVLTALTLASEQVSFTRVIEATPGLRELDRVGRRPQPA